MFRLEILRQLEDARDLIAERVDRPVRLEHAAKEACLSPYYFHRLFAQTYGYTPHEFHTERRIDQAKRLLVRSDLSVTEICFTLGYESLGAFSAMFKKRVGCSPTEYRIGAARFFACSTIKAHRFVPMCFVGSSSRLPH